MTDITEAKQASDIVQVIGSYVELRKVGPEWKGLCPFHDDHNPSMCVIPHKQFFWCHCGAAGDVIDFVRKKEGCSLREALEKLGQPMSPKGDLVRYPKSAPKPKSERKTYAPPADKDGMPDMRIPPNAEPAHAWGKPTTVYTYRGMNNEVLFYVGRYEWYDGEGDCHKTYRAFTYGDDGWKCGHWQGERPMYGQDRLATAGVAAEIVLVEGEKTADAGGELFNSRKVLMTWPGGAPGARYADLTPCRNRRVLIWPDNDDAGIAARDVLIERLEGIAESVWYWEVAGDDAITIGWDLADAVEQGWTATQIGDFSTSTYPRDTSGTSRLKQWFYPIKQAEAPAAIKILEPGEENDAPTKGTRASTKDIEETKSGNHWTLASWKNKMIMSLDEAPKPIKCIANCIAAMRHAPNLVGILGWDEMHQQKHIMRETPWGKKSGQWTFSDDVALRESLDRIGLHYGSGDVRDAADRVAVENPFHPVRDYLNSLVWDGKPRIATWLRDYAAVEDNAYTRFVSTAWMVSACARAIVPGSRVKTAMILIGDQDAGKSEILSILGGDWYGPSIGKIGGDSMKSVEQTSKLWIIELAELATIHGANTDVVKDFLSTNEDSYRPAYGRDVMSIKRCCVFAGTTNRREFLSDATGNVRFWPIEVGKLLDLSQLRADRDQLWAEAVQEYKAGREWWITDSAIRDIAGEEQLKRTVRDDWIDILIDWLEKPEQSVRKSFRPIEIMSGALGIETARIDRGTSLRFGEAMRAIGWSYRPVRLNGKSVRCWFRVVGVALGKALEFDGEEDQSGQTGITFDD